MRRRKTKAQLANEHLKFAIQGMVSTIRIGFLTYESVDHQNVKRWEATEIAAHWLDDLANWDKVDIRMMRDLLDEVREK